MGIIGECTQTDARASAGDPCCSTKKMTTALFINGVYDSVLAEILDAQDASGGRDSYLQPYKGSVVGMLRKRHPTSESPIRLYVSTTDNLSLISYSGLIVSWEDKRGLSQKRRNEVLAHLEAHQPEEVNLFQGVEKIGENAVNLIAIRDLRKLENPHSRALLRKVSDDKPYSRPRAGGWSEVYDDLHEFVDSLPETKDRYDEELVEAIAASSTATDSVLRERLSSATKLPEKVQIVSVGYRRNPDVIVSVLRRADGICERCKTTAPFLRRSDGSPYLEVHHWIPLSQGGEDTTDNAAALCPNCHREEHHGQTNSESGRNGD